MAGLQMRVMPGELATAGRTICEHARSYKDSVKNIYEVVNNLQEIWQGADNQAFANQVNSYRGNIDALGSSIDNYGVFLQETAFKLQELQANNASGASRL